MAKGLNSWTAQESGAPVTSAESKSAGSVITAIEFSSTTRAIMGVATTRSAFSTSSTLTLALAGGGTLVFTGKAAIDAVFAPGGIVPFACDSFTFNDASEDEFTVIGLF